MSSKDKSDSQSDLPVTVLASQEDKASLKSFLDADASAHGVRKKRWIIIGVLGLVFLGWFIPFIPALYFSSISVRRLDAKGKPIDVDVGPATKNWIPIDKVSRHVVNAVVVAEDSKFYQHHGFDFQAIAKAIELNRKKGRYVRGGSTISQQVVKMAFLSREKTIIRKVREAFGTLIMEATMSKDRILEWYINLCEFGGGIYGVKPAGKYYFKTRPELLTIEQAVHLAVVIPSPNKWSKGLRANSLTPFGQRRFGRIVTNMYLSGYITEVQKNTALARGNFGNPIAGYVVSKDDDDDCRGDRECEELASDLGGARPNVAVPEVKDEPAKLEQSPVNAPAADAPDEGASVVPAEQETGATP